MPLSDQDKKRIREEELYRLTVREEYRLAQHATRWKTVVFWLVMLVAAILLFALMRRPSG